jgi:hypothetical protein
MIVRIPVFILFLEALPARLPGQQPETRAGEPNPLLRKRGLE